jgi:hypothetical protein
MDKSKVISDNEKAVILLRTVRQGILTEKALKKEGYSAKKVAPPSDYRKGCEIAVEINLEDKEAVKKVLIKYKIRCEGIIEVN